MVAVPAATPVTVPFWSTFAMASLSDFQVTFLLPALAGVTVAVSFTVFLVLTVADS